MEKDRHTYLGQFVDDGSKQSEAIKESIKKLQNTYGDEVFKLSEGMEGTGSYKINFEADATTAKEALNDLCQSCISRNNMVHQMRLPHVELCFRRSGRIQRNP